SLKTISDSQEASKIENIKSINFLSIFLWLSISFSVIGLFPLAVSGGTFAFVAIFIAAPFTRLFWSVKTGQAILPHYIAERFFFRFRHFCNKFLQCHRFIAVFVLCNNFIGLFGGKLVPVHSFLFIGVPKQPFKNIYFLAS